jgi:glycosyltransferase involved in cell wall biosynthesis
MNSMGDMITTDTHAAADDLAIPARYSEIVGLNIWEARTKNFVRELERRGFRFTRFETGTWRALFRQSWPFIKTILRSESMLCGTVFTVQLPWILLAKLLRRRVIIDFPMDSTAWPFLTLRSWKLQVALQLRLADTVLMIKSRAYLIAKFALNRQRVNFIESCPDVELVQRGQWGRPRYKPRTGTLLICWSGGHVHHRLERFMPIFDLLQKLLPHAELLLIADPTKPSVISTLRYAEGAGLSDRIQAIPLIVPSEDFYATIAQCDIWVATLGDDTLQGRQELRMELLEAALLGKAVVAAPTPGLLEHGFTDRREIIFVDPLDPQGSALKLAEFARNPEMCTQLGERLRAYVIEHFSLKKSIDDMVDALWPTKQLYGSRPLQSQKDVSTELPKHE